jgi:hypothetical protein
MNPRAAHPFRSAALRAALFVLVLGGAACGGGTSPSPDAGGSVDAGGEVRGDSGAEVKDVGAQVPADTGSTAGSDVGPEVALDAGPEVGLDAGSEPDASGGLDGGDAGLWPCGLDCSKVPTAQCTRAECNEGQLLGPLYSCIVVPVEDGLTCDDGKFCTVADTCRAGACLGGPPNDCGVPLGQCEVAECDETAKSCSAAAGHEGLSCTPTDLCRVDGACQTGTCVGQPKDCSAAPLHECNTMACDPATGECVGTPDSNKDGVACSLTGDRCLVGKACLSGTCAGGAPKDCWASTESCLVGVCDPATGQCGADVAPEGKACNDHDSCTAADTCGGGACAGSPIAGCAHYLAAGFEACPGGWSLAGDWQCGTPTNVGPSAAHSGTGVLGTLLSGNYGPNQAFASAVADSPPIDLVRATNPMASFWAWDHTEGGTSDGWNLAISADGGQSFAVVTAVTPPYSLTIAGQPAWGGDHSAEGWQNFRADLTAYAGRSVILRLAFRSDAATGLPGVYLDDLVVDEPVRIPISITSPSALPDSYAGKRFSAALAKAGGTSAARWSLVPGGVNAAWLSIDPATGVLGGVPTAFETGPVRVTVHVEEPMLPANFAEQTFVFEVRPVAYYTGFEGACPNGWTLTGDWQCGAPVNVGPATAFEGAQCLGTNLAGPYSDLQVWAAAISPPIDLTALSSATLSFRMWVDTEGSTYDGFTLEGSTDGGATWSVVGAVTPAYPLVIAGKPAWGGHQAALGWQYVEADLSALAGQVIRLQFAFRSDSSGTAPGAYLDELLVR